MIELAGCAIGGCGNDNNYLGWIIAGSVLLLLIIVFIIWLFIQKKKQK